MLLLTLDTTYQTSIYSLEWHSTYVVQPVGCLMPLCLLFYWLTDWLFVCARVCTCVSTTVLLVSSYRDGAMCRNGPLCCLVGRHDPSRSMSITTWNLNVKHGPLLQPFVFLCGSVSPDTRIRMQNIFTCYCSNSLSCKNILSNKEVPLPTTNSWFRMCE